MKTAMQELMEWLDDSIPETIKEKYLEKEKEQIMAAKNDPTLKSPLEYYNQTYNQNK
jgi:hypothetical protein